jgi:tetratricopeptide (TPR) repeat protein
MVFLYVDMEEYQLALPVLHRHVKVCRQVFGPKHAEYAHSLHNLSTVYLDLGDYARAKPPGQEALVVYESAGWRNTLSYASSLDNLAAIYKHTGEYTRALPLCLESLALRQKLLGDKAVGYADGMHNLAGLYENMGDQRQALSLYRRALAIYKEAGRQKHPDYARTLDGLAHVYDVTGEHARAISLSREALALRKEVLGEKHTDYAANLNNLTRLLHSRGENGEAVTLFGQALAIYKVAGWGEHPDYARSLANLADVYSETGKHRQALALFRAGLALMKRTLGETHQDYAFTLTDLAELYMKMGQPYRALPLCGQSLAILRRHQQLAVSTQSERQQLSAARSISQPLHLLLMITATFPELSAVAHDAVLSAKGGVFRQQQQRRLLQHSDPGLLRRFEQLQEVNRELAALALTESPPAGRASRQLRLEELTRTREALESDLAGRSADFRRRQGRLTSSHLQRLLPSDAALIDFYHYQRVPAAVGERLHWRLAAFVLRRGAEVARVDLGRADAVEQAIDAWRQELGTKGGAAPGPLRKLVWQSLEKHLGGAKTVLISPDGALSRLPFAALPGKKEGAFLIEEVALAVVPVPQMLPDLLAGSVKKSKPSLLVVGDVDFDRAASHKTDGGRGAARRPLKNWPALPGTAREAAAVKDAFRSRFAQAATTSLAQSKASKPAVRRALATHTFAHLATHGFFAPKELKSALAGPRRG